MTASVEVVIKEKKGDFMGSTYERTFTVSVPVERAWRAMTDPEELNKWYFPFTVAEDGSATTEILGQERASEVVEIEPYKMFHTRTVLTGGEAWGIAAGTREMTVVFEAMETGTRITITNAGFGEGEEWERDLENAMRGQAETIKDLVLYLETGVAFPRHHHGENSWIGFKGTETTAGLQVGLVQAGTFASRLGLKAGDILVELGGASVFGFAEVQFFTKEHGAGEQTSAAWVRDGQLMRGSAELGERLAARGS
jgi:carbon monoxide dehydrogenase subunit G